MVNLSVGTEEIEVFLNGAKDEAPVTIDAIRYLMDGAGMDVTVRTTLELPVGQGLGMSGAGALSSCLAVCKIMGLPPEDAIHAAHIAAIKNGTGLGAFIAQSVGGLEMRTLPGIPPHGNVDRLNVNSKVILCVMSGERSTAKILHDKDKRGGEIRSQYLGRSGRSGKLRPGR